MHAASSPPQLAACKQQTLQGDGLRATHVAGQVGVAGILWHCLARRQVGHEEALVVDAQLLSHSPGGQPGRS